MKRIPDHRELRQLAEVHAIEIAALTNDGEVEDDGITGHRLEEFKETYQPMLVDKVFTALYKTYSSWLVAALRNHWEPGSAEYPPPHRVVDVQDGMEVHRQNRLALNEDLLADYTQAIHDLAKRCAAEIAAHAKDGQPTGPVLQHHYVLAALLDQNYGLTSEESDKHRDLFSILCTEEIDSAFKAVV